VLTRVFTICGVLLLPWTAVLVEQLHGHAGQRSFDSCWVGLPLAALLAWTAWHSLKWAAPREDTITTRAASPATPEPTG